MGEVNPNVKPNARVRVKAWGERLWGRVKRLPHIVWTWIWTNLKALWRGVVFVARAVGAWPLRRVLLWTAVVFVVANLAIIGSFFVAVRFLATQLPNNPPVDNIVYLDQGWGASVSSPQRQSYYYTPQGTSLFNLRYDWFINLERADSTERFASPNHMRAMGFIVDNFSTKQNPLLLPVGFTKHFDSSYKEEFLDITCAACHTGELHVISKAGEQVAIRIDGGAAMHAFTSARAGQFGPALMGSMTSTFLNPWKFDRFARNVLGDHYRDGYWHLRVEFLATLGDIVATAFSDTVHGKYPIDEGFGRTDAVARISNHVFGDELDPANYIQGTGPVSYPSIWHAPKYDWVQYTGSVSQPLARNWSESLGVGAPVELIDAYGKPVPEEYRFSSESMVDNLTEIEATIETLKGPQWPDQILGAVDPDKVKAGRQLYEKHCQGCHDVCLETPYRSAVTMPMRSTLDLIWRTNLIPIEEVGTDPQTALNFNNARINLEKTGIRQEDVRKLLGEVYREQALRKWYFGDLKTKFEDWSKMDKKSRPSEEAFLSSANEARRQDRVRLQQQLVAESLTGEKMPLLKKEQDEIDRNLDAISIKSTSIGQALNYIGFFLKDRYFKEQKTQTLPNLPSQLTDELGQFIISGSNFYTMRMWDLEARQSMDGWGALDLPQVKRVYKAKPLEGIWATAPYLHNGSVPTLWELLLPAENRSKKFFITRMNFDPVLVGLAKTPAGGRGFWFDTSIPGNLNIGHEFRAGYGGYGPGSSPSPGVVGPALTDPERWALIEYLKVHKDEPKLCEHEYEGY